MSGNAPPPPRAALDLHLLTAMMSAVRRWRQSSDSSGLLHCLHLSLSFPSLSLILTSLSLISHLKEKKRRKMENKKKKKEGGKGEKKRRKEKEKWETGHSTESQPKTKQRRQTPEQPLKYWNRAPCYRHEPEPRASNTCLSQNSSLTIWLKCRQ